jgi:hypothetical protein
MTPGLSSLFRPCLRGFSQEGLNISSQRDFHFRLRLFKAARLNSDGRFFAAATPTVICEPELAIDTKKWCHPKRYGVISHKSSPHLNVR